MKKRKIIALLVSSLIIMCSATVVLAQFNDSTGAKEIEQNLAKQKNFSLSQIDALVDMGYSYDEISQMSLEQANQILTKDLTPEERERYYAVLEQIQTDAINIMAAASPPSGYTKVAEVPDGGGTDEWFHPDAKTTESTIASIVSNAKAGAQKIFKSSLTYPSLKYSYYLFGEWGEDPGRENWCHEGVDLKHATISTAAVYSPISGVVSKSSTSGKYVNIYNSTLGITMNFQHLNNVDGTGTLLEGKPVTVGQFLGNQNTSDGHVHVQTCKHTNCTQVHSGQDLTLMCVAPYSYIK